MKTKLIRVSTLALMLIITIYGSSRSAADVVARDEPEPISGTGIEGTEAVLKVDPIPNRFKVAPPPGVFDQSLVPKSVDTLPIVVNYNPLPTCADPHPDNNNWMIRTWPANAQTAMDHAALIWSTLLNGTRTVTVDACWYSSLGAGTLGAAMSMNNPSGFANAPQANTRYPVALANQLAGADLNGVTPEIRARFSARFSESFTWYFGLDGNIPVDEFGNPTAHDFLTVALHEIGHGLGFNGSANWDNGVVDTAGDHECDGTANWGCVADPPHSYDRLVRSGNTNIVGGFTNPSLALGNVLIGNNLFFNGTAATAANGGNAPRLFAPNPWVVGSSYGHLDEVTFNNTVNALMTPNLAAGEVLHHPGPVGLGVMADVGWTVNGFTAVAVDKSNTGFEDGSFDHPYNTVQEGVAAVRDNGLVYIAAGNYDERLTIRRPMSLLATGGVVRIGE